MKDSPSLQVHKIAITQQPTMKGVRVRGGDKARIIRLSGNIGSGRTSSASCVFCSDEGRCKMKDEREFAACMRARFGRTIALCAYTMYIVRQGMAYTYNHI